MSKYKFKLQKLLDIRINEEEESKLLYSQAQNNKNIVENKLIELENNYKKYSDISIAKDTITQKITMNYLTHLNTHIKDTKKELQTKEIELEKAKKDFIDKRIKRSFKSFIKSSPEFSGFIITCSLPEFKVAYYQRIIYNRERKGREYE